MELDVPGTLKDLESVAAHLATLLELDQLAEQERDSRALPPFRLQDHNREDIVDLYSQFLNLRTGIHAVLDSQSLLIPDEDRESWKERLWALEQQVRRLRIMERFIRP
ncbi:MAG: hypothetical protein IPK83_19110 [Planctomycetes bacterium]|nr:hypothetical protein [Planctomycetota bacterium]